jgi:hypothetical protein
MGTKDDNSIPALDRTDCQRGRAVDGRAVRLRGDDDAVDVSYQPLVGRLESYELWDDVGGFVCFI